MDQYDDIDSLADDIAGNTMAPKGAAKGIEEGATPSPALDQPDEAELAAAEDALAAVAANDVNAFNEALKNHYAICAGKASKSEKK